MAEGRASPVAAATPRCRFQSPNLDAGSDARPRGSADERLSSRRVRKKLSPPYDANDDRQLESPTWEDVEDARPTRVRKQSARRATTTSSSSSSSSRGSRASNRSSTSYHPELSNISEGGETGDQTSFKSTPHHRDRGSSTHARRSGSGLELGVSSARRSVRQKHSSLLRRADALSNLSSPSLLSVFSSLTHSSGTSSGSNSTVTQKSYERSNITKRRRPKDRSKHSDSQVSSNYERAERRRRGSTRSTHSQASKGPANVGEIASPPPARDYPVSTKASAVDRDRVNSDSGISVRDSSPEASDRNRMAQDLPTPQSDGSADEEIIERQLEIERLYRELSRESYAGLVPEAEDPLLRRLLAQEESLRQHILQTPQQPRGRRHYDDGSRRDDSSFPYYAPQPQQGPYWDPTDASPSPAHVPIPDPGHLTAPYGQYPPQTSFVSQFMQHDAPDLTKTTIAGYEKLATELAESTSEARDETNRGIRPVYRRFEYLNHRILLHIQDELAEMEEELRLVDEYIAQTTAVGDDEDAQPASRRLERRYGGDLHSRRTLLLGNIYVKLGQYNSAMSSYGNMMKVLEPAKAEDISRYQAWLHLHAPISEAESRFLKRGADLMALPRRHEQQRRQQQQQQQQQQEQQAQPQPRIFGVHGLDTLQSATLALPLFLVLPLIAYSIIPGIGGRLFVLAILGITEATMVASTRFYQIMTFREWGVCAAAYFVLMVIIAGVVR